MSEKIDWSKAPEGATHHIAENNSTFECWLKPGYAVRVSRGSSDWVRNDYADKLIADYATARPTTPSWSGEGLPPVGVVCERQQQNGDWAPVNVLAHAKMSYGEDVVVFQDGDKITFSNPRYFRPIRTPEQIAADEREAAIKEIASVINIANCMDCGTHTASAIYEAGYRKP